MATQGLRCSWLRSPSRAVADRGESAQPGGRFAVLILLLGVGLSGAARGQVVTEFPVSSFAEPYGIAAGPDGNLWFTEYEVNHNNIGRITTTGVVTEFAIPTAGSGPTDVAAGPDGNLWFTELQGNKIGRITVAGVITEFPIPTAGASPQGITAGPDGNLWFTEEGKDQIGRITTTGVITEFPTPTAASTPWGIAAGPDGNLWFAEYNGNNIGRITTGAQPPATVVIDGCDSGVPDVIIPDGGTITDAIAQCAAGAGNHGAFVSCVRALTNNLKDQGIITGAQKGAIQGCAGQAQVP